MPKRNRIAYPGAWYHIYNRGSARKTICFTEENYRYFLYLLEEISTQYNIEIHAFCMMKNHYHIMIRTPEPNISQAMWFFGFHFSRYLNKELNVDGPLFRGRFKDTLIDKTCKLLHVCRYIHLNPVDAYICDSPEDYEWSSYRSYLNPNLGPSFLHRDTILSHFLAENEFKEFTDFGVDEETKAFYSSKRTPSIYGSKDFVETFRTRNLPFIV